MDNHLWDDLLTKYRLPLALGFVGLVLLIGGVVSSGIIPKTFLKSSKLPAKSTANVSVASSYQAAQIKVDVSGAVKTPGVYTLSIDSRVEDVLKLAGGPTEEADPEYLTKSLNLAQKISDGMKIYIPQKGEVISGGVREAGGSGVVAGVQGQSELINLNQAALSDLDKLPGVGPVTAQKIIDGRPYNGIEDLYTKKVVSGTVYEKIKDKVGIW